MKKKRHCEELEEDVDSTIEDDIKLIRLCQESCTFDTKVILRYLILFQNLKFRKVLVRRILLGLSIERGGTILC